MSSLLNTAFAVKQSGEAFVEWNLDIDVAEHLLDILVELNYNEDVFRAVRALEIATAELREWMDG